MRETRSDGGTFFFGITEEEGEVLDCGHGNIPTVVAGQKGLMITEGVVSQAQSIRRNQWEQRTYLALQVEEE